MESLGEIMERQKGQQLPAQNGLKPVLEDPSAEYKCELCHDAEWVYSPSTQEAVRCECVKEKDKFERNKRYLKLCRLPANSEHMTFEGFEVVEGTRDAYDAALQLASDSGEVKWLTLMGEVDRGKTHLAIAICRQWLANQKPARYANVPLLLDELRVSYSPKAVMDYDAELHFFLNVPLLVLDDLGTEYPTPWAQEKLDLIIDYRYINGLSLVVTANVPLDEISPRIASRLQRYRGGRVVVLEGIEYRLRRAD